MQKVSGPSHLQLKRKKTNSRKWGRASLCLRSWESGWQPRQAMLGSISRPQPSALQRASDEGGHHVGEGRARWVNKSNLAQKQLPLHYLLEIYTPLFTLYGSQSGHRRIKTYHTPTLLCLPEAHSKHTAFPQRIVGPVVCTWVLGSVALWRANGTSQHPLVEATCFKCTAQLCPKFKMLENENIGTAPSPHL